MEKPLIFLGSSGKQAELLQALALGLADVAQVEAWMSSFNPGTTTLERLFELTRQVDFAAFVFAQDDWTGHEPAATTAPAPGQASPRDNVVFEAGLFGGILGLRRTFILHANGAKLPTDLLGLTCVRYDGSTAAAEIEGICSKLRNAIAAVGRARRIEGLWWQYSLTQRTAQEPSVLGLLRIARDRNGVPEMTGRAWQEDGALSARYWSEAAREKEQAEGIFYYWKGERPLHPDAPRLEGTGEMRLESVDRATGYFTTRGDEVQARTAGVYLRADADEVRVMDGSDNHARARLIAKRVGEWRSIRNS